MDEHVQQAKAFAIARMARMPGFREVVELLDQLAQQAKNEAFDSPDDSRAVRLLHEGRGAAQLVTRFKHEIDRLKQEQETPLG